MTTDQRRLGENEYQEPTSEDSIDARKKEAVRQTAEAAINALSEDDLDWADSADTPQNATRQIISSLFDTGKISQIEGMRKEDPRRLQLLAANRRGDIINELHTEGLTGDAFDREVNAINFLENVITELGQIMTERLASKTEEETPNPTTGSVRNALQAAIDQ